MPAQLINVLTDVTVRIRTQKQKVFFPRGTIIGEPICEDNPTACCTRCCDTIPQDLLVDLEEIDSNVFTSIPTGFLATTTPTGDGTDTIPTPATFSSSYNGAVVSNFGMQFTFSCSDQTEQNQTCDNLTLLVFYVAFGSPGTHKFTVTTGVQGGIPVCPYNCNPFLAQVDYHIYDYSSGILGARIGTLRMTISEPE